MNNVVSFFNTPAPVFGGFGEADFEIETSPLFYLGSDNHYHESTKKVIYRTDNNAELGVHGSKYKAVAPKHMIEAARKIILRSELDTDGIRETIRTSHNGSRTFVKYDLPAHSYVTPDGDKAHLNLLAITSFDSSWPFMISVAATQMACTNLQVFTSGEIAVYKSKHTIGLDIDRGARIIVKALDTFESQKDLWAKWNNTTISHEEAFEFFVDAAGCRDSVNKLREDNPAFSAMGLINNLPRRNKNLEYMFKVYHEIYHGRLGKNLWAVYNAMTDWATHAPASQRSQINIASIEQDRAAKVRETVNKSIEFKMAA
jgi:hypothetical protein